MKQIRLSIIAYSAYLGTAGLCMALIPNVLIPLFGLEPTDEVWVRLFGFLAFVLGVKGIQGARQGYVRMMQLDVYTRLTFGVFLTVLVLMGLSPPVLLAFAVIDLAAAAWTEVALRRAGRKPSGLFARAPDPPRPVPTA